jgi:hypothetical protein
MILFVLFCTYISSLFTEAAAEPKVGARYSHRIGESPHVGYEPETAAMDFRSKIILSIKPRDKISPHTLLGNQQDQ